MRLFSTSLAFSNRTSSNRNHCLWLLYGRKLNVKVPVLQAWFSLQYTNIEYSTIADRAINWGTVFPFLSRERKMSLWKMVIYWAAMDGLSGAGKTLTYFTADSPKTKVFYLSKAWRMVLLSRKALYRERRSCQGAANMQLAFLGLCALAAYVGCTDISPLSLMLFYCSG